MSGQHTPGPWLVEDPLGNGPGDSIWIGQEGASSEVYDWRNLAVVCSDNPEGMDSSSSKPITVIERDANARLIAAAPELLEACEQFMPKGIAIGNGNVPDDLVVPMDVTMGELRKFEAAIAKARGQA